MKRNIENAAKALRELAGDCLDCSRDAALERRPGESRAWDAAASRITRVVADLEKEARQA